MAFEEGHDQEPESNRLGSGEVQNDGETLTARFGGKGVLTVGHTDGSFIADRRPLSKFDMPDKTLSFENMFPEEWQDRNFEYQITVKAKKVHTPRK